MNCDPKFEEDFADQYFAMVEKAVGANAIEAIEPSRTINFHIQETGKQQSYSLPPRLLLERRALAYLTLLETRFPGTDWKSQSLIERIGCLRTISKIPDEESKPTAVFLDDQKLEIESEPIQVSYAQSKVIKALVDAHPYSLSLVELQKAADTDDPQRLLKRAIKDHPILAKYITFKGHVDEYGNKQVKGYRTTIFHATPSDSA